MGCKTVKIPGVFGHCAISRDGLPSLEIVSISRDEFVISRDEVPFLEIDSISRDGCPISRIQFRHGFMRRGARRHGVCSDRMRHLGFPSARLILKF